MRRRPVNEVCARKLDGLGEEGARWYDQLDDLVAELESRWGITVGDPIGGGSHGFVAEAVTDAGEAAVLKIALPDMRGNAKSLDMLRVLLAGQGHGYVEVLAHDEVRRAVLMERLGADLDSSGKPVDEQIRIICGILSPWAPAPAELELMTGAAKAAWLARFAEELWEELGRPISKAALRQAQDFALLREAAHDPAAAVLLHGDAHQTNVLLAADGSYRLIDPDPMIGEPAVDLAVLMRDWNRELLASGAPSDAAIARCRLIAKITAVAPQPIWEWGFIERVTTALYCHSLGIDSWYPPAYEVIEACVGVRTV